MRVIWWYTKKAEKWIRKNCCFEPYQEMANGIACNWRMAEDIIKAMTAENFILGKHFGVS